MKITKICKRVIVGTLLGAVFGILCFAGFSSNPDIPAEFAKFQVWGWGNIWIWQTVANRMLLGLLVALGGVVTTYPLFNFKIPAFLRGAKLGLIASLPMALGALMGPNPEMAHKSFWIILIFGTVIGLIIDVILTKLYGEGKKLLA